MTLDEALNRQFWKAVLVYEALVLVALWGVAGAQAGRPVATYSAPCTVHTGTPARCLPECQCRSYIEEANIRKSPDKVWPVLPEIK